MPRGIQDSLRAKSRGEVELIVGIEREGSGGGIGGVVVEARIGSWSRAQSCHILTIYIGILRQEGEAVGCPLRDTFSTEHNNTDIRQNTN